MKCLKCGYERQPRDNMYVPATECPACGVVYVKSGAGLPKNSQNTPLPTLRKASALDESSLKQARQRVEMRLRQKNLTNMKDERHAQTLERARRFASAETSKRVAARNGKKLPQADLSENVEVKPATTPEPVSAELLNTIRPVEETIVVEMVAPMPPAAPEQDFDSKPAEIAVKRSKLSMKKELLSMEADATPAPAAPAIPKGPRQREALAIDISPAEPSAAGVAAVEPRGKKRTTPAPKEAHVAVESSSTAQPTKEKTRSTIIKQRKLREHDDIKKRRAYIPADHHFDPSMGYARQIDHNIQTGSGLMRMLSIVAWLILVAGVVGMGLSWTTMGSVEAGIRSDAPAGLSTMPLGLLLGFAYLATGVLGFAFFWVASLITRQLKDIRRLLLIQQSPRFPDDAGESADPVRSRTG